MTVRHARRLSYSGALLALCLAGVGRAACPETESAAIRANQVGFIADGAKRAIVATAAADPVRWSLVDSDGDAVLSGSAQPFGADPRSGERLQRIDFSAARDTGEGFRIRTDCAASHPFRIAAAPYGRLPYDALAYFYHNRSGMPIEAKYAGGAQWARPAGHPHDVATCRSGKDSYGNDWPGCDYRPDVSGGWYDAGDQGKYVVNGGITVWTLLDLYEWQRAFGRADAFEDGRASIPEAGNGVSDLLDEARYEIEFLLRMQAPDGAAATVPVGVKAPRAGLTFVPIDASGMAHHKIGDANWTALPTPPHEDAERRYLYPVSTAATLNLAAVAAQCARIWRDIDAAFAARCLTAARRAYTAAVRNPEVYFIADFPGSGMYGDGELADEFFWAAAELYVTTGAAEYAAAVRNSPWFDAAIDGEPGWNRVAALGLFSLAVVPGALPDDELRALRGRIAGAAARIRDEREAVGYYIPFAARTYYWGSNAVLLNRAILLGLAATFTGDASYRDAAADVMDYLLGRNPLDQSYVSGYGATPMRFPHHRFWARGFAATSPPPPPGVLSGGPNSGAPADDVARTMSGCAPQTCWRDDARAYSLNEVAINWNAPLVWVATYLGRPAAPAGNSSSHSP
jgi:endoglucanase